MPEPQVPTPAAFEQAEADLLRLGERVDAPNEPNPYLLVLAYLGFRSLTLFRAVLDVHAGRAKGAANVLIRPMVEINVLVRFLQLDPALHTELWEQEGERNAITIADEIMRSPEMSKLYAAELDIEGFKTRREKVAEVRAKARKAKIAGVEKKGSLLPSISVQLRTIDERIASELYTMAYRSLSWDVHGGSRAILGGKFKRRDKRLVYVENEPTSITAPRALAISTFALTLAICSGPLGLDIDDETSEILRAFLPQAADSSS